MSSDKKQSFESRHNICCESSNLIYCITCKKCKQQYVGQTKRTLWTRISEHLADTRRKRHKSDVSRHFNQHDHNGVRDLEIHVLDFIYRHPDSKRAKELRILIEHNWIHRLVTYLPNGMNLKDSEFN